MRSLTTCSELFFMLIEGVFNTIQNISKSYICNVLLILSNTKCNVIVIDHFNLDFNRIF